MGGAPSRQEELIQDARERSDLPLDSRERAVEGVSAALFAIACAALVIFVGPNKAFQLEIAAPLFAGYVLSSRIKFDVGTGYTNTTQLMIVPMLLLLPVQLVPAIVAVGNLAGELPEYVARKRHPERALISISDSWYVVGPALVLIFAGVGEPALSDWPVYLAAFGAQVIFDIGGSAIREWLEYGVAPQSQAGDTGWYLTVDALLSPLGLALALAVVHGQEALLLTAPLLGLLAIFASQRKEGLEKARELSEAYRGTTLLLADVIEHDDFYTGRHSKGVVSLSLEVADAMGVDPERRRNVEFAALLHDVGKIAVPKEIVNKTGPLSSQEWVEMKRHTVYGEEMLKKIGGLFDDVARVVRSSHENWDGTGYPDGLVGVSIPLEARIVSCCDAFNAMTTDRPYRLALTTEEALDELRRNAGTQFDPGVAWTVVRLIEEDEQRAAAWAAAAGLDRAKAHARRLEPTRR